MLMRFLFCAICCLVLSGCSVAGSLSTWLPAVIPSPTCLLDSLERSKPSSAPGDPHRGRSAVWRDSASAHSFLGIYVPTDTSGCLCPTFRKGVPMLRKSVNKRRSARAFRRNRQKSRRENFMVMRGGFRL